MFFNTHFSRNAIFIFFIQIFSITFLAGQAPPTITSLSTFSGPTSGGTIVEIAGTGFLTITDVNFGNKPAIFAVNSDQSITAISPIHTPQTVSITLTNPFGTSSNLDTNSFFVYQGTSIAYVSNAGDNTISVIDTAPSIPFVTHTIPLIARQTIVAFTIDGTKAYVANYTGNDVTVIDVATHTQTNIPLGLPINNVISSIVATPDGKSVYATRDNVINVIDVATDTVSIIPTPFSVYALGITPDSTRTFVGSSPGSANPSTLVIDNATNTIIANVITPGDNARGIAIIPDGTKAYIAKTLGNNVTVVRIADNVILADIPVLDSPVAVSISVDGTRAVVVNQVGNAVSIIDTLTDTLITHLTVGDNPTGALITPDGTQAYVNSFNTTDVTRVDWITQSTQPIPIGVAFTDVLSLSLTPTGGKVLAPNENNASVTVIDATTDNVSAVVPVGINPLTAIPPADQAPLAKFTFTINPLNPFEVLFNASASISPVGTIVNYFWDFGDGETLNTPLAMISHTYFSTGPKTVTLVVTNSAGTSDRQIFYSSSTYGFSVLNNFSFTQTTNVINNGGITARLTQEVVLPATPISPPFPQPPRNFKACIKENKYGDLIVTLYWRAPSSEAEPISYLIFKDDALTQLVAEVPANRLKFVDIQPLLKYYIVTVDAIGQVSTAAKAETKPCCRKG